MCELDIFDCHFILEINPSARFAFYMPERGLILRASSTLGRSGNDAVWPKASKAAIAACAPEFKAECVEPCASDHHTGNRVHAWQEGLQIFVPNWTTTDGGWTDERWDSIHPLHRARQPRFMRFARFE